MKILPLTWFRLSTLTPTPQAVAQDRTRLPLQVFPHPLRPSDPIHEPGIHIERFTIFTDTGEQGLTPTLLLSPRSAGDPSGPSETAPVPSTAADAITSSSSDDDDDDGDNSDVDTSIPTASRAPATHPHPRPRHPCVLFLHATGTDKESLLPEMIAFTRRGYVACAIDARYHGERDPWASLSGVPRAAAYNDALVRAWRGETAERPFLLDTTWDLLGIVDFLTEFRPDVDPGRIGVTGISLGGMHAWLLAALEPRIRAAAPRIGIQNFGWALEHQQYHARCASIPDVFEAAQADLDTKSESDESESDALTPRVVRAVWEKLLPGLLGPGGFDTPNSLPLIAPRALAVINAAEDARNPMPGLWEHVLGPTWRRYEALVGAARVAELFQVFFQEGVGHRPTPEMAAFAAQFLDQHLGLHA